MTSSTQTGARSLTILFTLLGVVTLSGCIKPFGDSAAPDDADTVNIPPSYALGGTYTGLIGSRLILNTAGGNFNERQVGAVTAPTGTFYLESLSAGSPYDVTVTTQPTNPSQTCVIANGVGTMGNSDVTNIVVTCTTNPARFVYVVNNGSNDVSAYRVDPASGALAPIAGSPFPAGNTPDSIAVDPTGRFAYVSNLGDATVSAYTINRTTGALEIVSGSPFPTGQGPTSVAIDPSSSFVYVTNGTGGSVSVYTVDAGSGALKNASSSPFATGSSPSFVLVEPLDDYAYVANLADATISVFLIDIVLDGTGTLTPIMGSPFATDPGPRSLAVDSSDRYLYVANATSNTLSGLNIGTGVPSAVSGSPNATESMPTSVAIDPLDRFVYVANQGSNNVSAFALDATTGALSPLAGSPFATGNNPGALAIDPKGQFTLVTNTGSNTVSVYGIDAQSGALTPISGSPFATGTSPSAVAISD